MTKAKAPLKLVKFDAAKYLDDDEAIAEYMTAVLEMEDPDLLHPEGFAGLVHGIPRDMDTATSYVYYTCKEGSCAAN